MKQSNSIAATETVVLRILKNPQHVDESGSDGVAEQQQQQPEVNKCSRLRNRSPVSTKYSEGGGGDAMAESPKTVMNPPLSGYDRQDRRVRFGEYDDFIPNNLPPASSMTLEERRRIWWQHSDYDTFKRTAKMIANEIQKRHRSKGSAGSGNAHSYSDVVRRTYGWCCKASRELQRIQPQADENQTHVFVSQKDLLHLQQWAEVGTCRRGLEKWSVVVVARDRQRRKEMTVQGVLEIQRRARAIGGLDNDDISEFIRTKSVELSR